MKALAEFILRGRLQALMVALIGSFFPLISTAAIALVSLCKGAKEGTLLFLWVSLALVLLQQSGTENPLLTAVSIVSLGIMVLAAEVHRVMASWQWTLLVIVVIAVVSAQGFAILMGASVTSLVATAQDVLNAVKSQGQDAQLSIALSESMLLGLVATILAIGSMMSLMLARWWQAGVQNPGGFQKEFHGFSIDAKIAVILIVTLVVGQFFSQSTQIWVNIAALPLIIAGIALVHFAVKLFGQGRQWLAFLYVGMIMVGKPVTLLLVVLALTDSLIDLRSRLEGFKKAKT
ncbi:MAG: hypothetical protein CMQ88_02730 [Gammaproteobacteria bacterium]|nr:hypothetical protein [Gammaproteobacteria bacterium]